MKKWYLSKSVWLGVLICIGGVAEYVAGLPAGVSISTMVAGILGVIVRFLTKEGVTK